MGLKYNIPEAVSRIQGIYFFEPDKFIDNLYFVYAYISALTKILFKKKVLNINCTVWYLMTQLWENTYFTNQQRLPTMPWHFSFFFLFQCSWKVFFLPKKIKTCHVSHHLQTSTTYNYLLLSRISTDKPNITISQ